MSADSEPDDLAPRTFVVEGPTESNVLRTCRPVFEFSSVTDASPADIVDDDKVDLSRMAENEHASVRKQGLKQLDKSTKPVSSRNYCLDSQQGPKSNINEHAVAHQPVLPRKRHSSASDSSTNSNSVLNLSSSGVGTLLIDSKLTDGQNNATAFSAVSPSCTTAAAAAASSALFFQRQTAAQQMLQNLSHQYYNGLLYSGNRLPFSAYPPHSVGLASAIVSPLYGTGLYSPNPCLIGSGPTLLGDFTGKLSQQPPQNAPSLFSPTPFFIGCWSPSFVAPFDPHRLTALQNVARIGQETRVFPLSPLQSPNTGTSIIPLASKVPNDPCPPPPSVVAASSNSIDNESNGLLLNKANNLSMNVFEQSASYNNSTMASAAYRLSSPRQHKKSSMYSHGFSAKNLSQSSDNALHQQRVSKKRAQNENDDGGLLKAMANSSSGRDNEDSGHNGGCSDVQNLVRLSSDQQFDIGNHRQRESRDHLQPYIQKRQCSIVNDDANNSNKPHIKKPLNAFMLYMKEMRPIVMEEEGLKERQSAEINRILGKRWHSLSRDDQQKYYKIAEDVRTEHLQKYPGWSARDNYAIHKKKKKRDRTFELEGSEAKKCRAKFGMDRQSEWCKHCRRKKKCLWSRDTESNDESTTTTNGGVAISSSSDSVSCIRQQHQLQNFFSANSSNQPSNLPLYTNETAVVENNNGVRFFDQSTSNYVVDVKKLATPLTTMSPSKHQRVPPPSSSNFQNGEAESRLKFDSPVHSTNGTLLAL